MSYFRKKPVVIEAWQWDGTEDSLWNDAPEWLPVRTQLDGEGTAAYEDDIGPRLAIGTLEGVHLASPHDWIIKGVKGEIYACKPDIFEATYEAVDKSP